MAHDPKREDYQRLGLRFACGLDAGDPTAAARSFSSFGRRFAQDRDSLPQSDADRAFHLVVLAAEVVDYSLPFAREKDAEALIRRGRDLLDEAISLDPNCHDAVRMRSSTEASSVDQRYHFLVEHADAVRASCEEVRDHARSVLDDERGALAQNIAMRPWWRWLSSMAEEALVCGRNRAAVAACEQLLEADPADMSDARFTLAFALAKLEDDKALEELAANYPGAPRAADDAWLSLARLALAHKRCDFDGARRQLRLLLEAYPDGAVSLIRQNELPGGEFARLHVMPYSDDELILALSEGVVLLQEGNDRSGRGVLGSWLAAETTRLDPAAAIEAERLSAGEGVQP